MSYASINLIDLPKYSQEQVVFSNQILHLDLLKTFLEPIIEHTARYIESSYKSYAKVEIIGAKKPGQKKLQKNMQIDDLCVKFLHVATQEVFFVNLSANLARTFLCRLISSSLIDPDPKTPFSSTEKGIFAFMLARLLNELNKSLHNNMPPLKILEVLNFNDVGLNTHIVENFISFDFALHFLASRNIISLLLPARLCKIKNLPKPSFERIIGTLGHLPKRLSFIAYRMKAKLSVLNNLNIGDMIFFDCPDLHYESQGLFGLVEAYWHFRKSFSCQLTSKDGAYFAQINHLKEGGPIMNNLECDEENSLKNGSLFSDSDFSEMAQNIEVSANIELASLALSLNEICQLKKGQILALGKKIDEPLKIKVENKTIAYCLPIMIEDQVGIKIIKTIKDDD